MKFMVGEPPLVLLHHGAGSVKMWEDLLPEFIKHFRVVMYDRRGFGRSGKGDNFRDYYRSERYIRNSTGELSALLDHLGIEQGIYFLGQCEGGAIGFHYAAQYPDKVKAIATSSTMCCSLNGQSGPPQATENENPSSFESAPPEFQQNLIHWHGETYAPEFFSLFAEGGGAYGTDPGTFDIRKTLQNVQCPALVLYPDRSRFFGVEQAVTMYRSLPQGELAILPHCGHNTYTQEPEEYQRIVLSFFERHKDCDIFER